MKRKGTRFTSLLIVFAIILSLLPPLTAHADGARIDINSLYVSATRPTGTEDNKVQRLTTNPISVSAYINNISDAMVPNIYYEVENINNGKIIVEKMNKAQVSGNVITFSNVYLSEGLNKITIKLGETSVVASSPGWAYFTPVTNISELLVNNVPFDDGKMYPANMTTGSTNTALNFAGKATNAADVQAILMGDPTPKSNYFVNGNFIFSADDVAKRGTTLSNMFLNAGDNRITFVAKNNSNMYQLERNFIYDNGSAFAFNVSVQEGTSPAKPLITQPTVTSSPVTIKAQVKIPLTVTAGTYSMKYQYMKVMVDNVPLPSAGTAYDLSNPSAGITRNNAASKPGYYDVFDFQYSASLGNLSKTKVVNFTFYDFFPNPTLLPVDSTYSFTYTDPNLPYIDSANLALTNAFSGASKDPGVRMNDLAPNSINEQPKKLRIFGDAKTERVNIYIDGTKVTSTPISPETDATEINLLNDPTSNVFLYQLEGLNNGNHSVDVIPLYDNDPDPAVTNFVENLSGSKTYTVTVTSAPYVILDNLYNGQIIKNVQPANALTCPSFSGGGTLNACLQGRFVNVPISELTNVQVTVNDGVPMKFMDADFGGNPTEVADNQKIGKFRFGYADPAKSRTGALQEGRNTIKFYIYNNKQLLTLVTYEVFVYTTEAPDFVGTVKPTPAEASDQEKFIAAKNPDTYSTNETSVIFKGKFTGATSLKVTARSKNAEGIPVYNSHELNLISSSLSAYRSSSTDETIGVPPYLAVNSVTTSTGEFSTLAIRLNPKGDTVFEFEITNASNIKVIKTVTISREPLPYKISVPTLIKNDKNEDQANINSNFQKIVMEAEFADKVLFGKEEAINEDVPGNKYIFSYEAQNLKPGKNTIKFTVLRGTQKTNGSIVLYNMDTSVEGASFKAQMASSFRVFDGDIQLKFPKDTALMRNEESNNNQFLTTDRDLLFGIANPDDGRVDKSIFTDIIASNLLKEPTLRFKSASKLFWIDTGTITPLTATLTESELEKGLRGSGRIPYDNVDKFYYRTVKDQVVPTQRGTLTLKYNPNVRDNAWKYLTVYHFGLYENKNGQVVPMWKNVGGVVDPGKNTITAPFEAPGYYQVMYMAKSFQDVTNHPWAREDIDTLYSKGIMENKSVASFIPNDFITRGEFTTLLVKIFEIPMNYDGEQTFEDVGLFKMDDLADYKYIETAARAGIVRGLTETQFMPNMTITRQDAAVMISRAADLKLGNDTEKSLVNLQKMFTDANGINVYARTAVEAISKAGLIEGKENVMLQGQKKATVRFDPLESFTRAEAATVAIRVLKQQKKIPK